MSVISEAIKILLKEATIRDMNIARAVLSRSLYSIIIVKKGNVIFTDKDNQIKSIVSAIEKLNDEIQGAVVGCSMIGKAVAYLFRYAKPDGVHSPKATKAGVALLIMAGIPSEIDEMILDIKNINDDSLRSIEKILSDVDSPEEAYKILKKKFRKKRDF